ncbi:MAG: DUF177 domain-containing protein [Alphaproteobacteria bacterium]|nr:DUF177 domain-containing protein [Alphaproteobacteria bacterium]
MPLETMLVASLSDSAPNTFEITPDANARASFATFLGISGIRKLRFSGVVHPQDRKDWSLEGALGATVIQSCVVTNKPVTTRIDVKVKRLFLWDFDKRQAPSDESFDGDDDSEALGLELDLTQVMAEALALNLPQYPRAQDAHLDQSAFAPPGVAPMRDEDTKPFAGLAELGKKLSE